MSDTKEQLITTYFCSGGTFGDKVLVIGDRKFPLGSFSTSNNFKSGLTSCYRHIPSVRIARFVIGNNSRTLYMNREFIFNQDKKLIAICRDDIEVEFGYFTKANEIAFLHKLFYRWGIPRVIKYVDNLDAKYVSKINFNLKSLSAKKDLEKQILEYVTNN